MSKDPVFRWKVELKVGEELFSLSVIARSMDEATGCAIWGLYGWERWGGNYPCVLWVSTELAAAPKL